MSQHGNYKSELNNIRERHDTLSEAIENFKNACIQTPVFKLYWAICGFLVKAISRFISFLQCN